MNVLYYGCSDSESLVNVHNFRNLRAYKGKKSLLCYFLNSVRGGVYVNNIAGKFFLSTQFPISVNITNSGGENINDWWMSQDIVFLHDPANT